MVIDTIPLAVFLLCLCPHGHRKYDGWFSDDLFQQAGREGGSNFQLLFFEYAITVVHTGSN